MNLSSTKLYFLLLLASTFTFVACSDDDNPVVHLTVKETIAVHSNLSGLEEAFEATELDSILSNEGPVTLFAPVNDAFPQEVLSGDELEAALKYHLVAMNLTYENMQDIKSVITLSGEKLFFSAKNTVTINNGQATISTEGIEASNGRVFIIEDIMAPYIIGTITDIKKLKYWSKKILKYINHQKPGVKKCGFIFLMKR